MLIGCGGSDPAAPDAASPIDGPPDAAIDASIDDDGGGAGFRVEVATIGIRDPLPITLSAGGADQSVLVTQDTGTQRYRFAQRLADGTAFTLATGGAQACTTTGPSTIAGADAVVTVVCDGVVDLAGFSTSRALRLTPAFDPRVAAYVARQPLLLEPDETTAVLQSLAYPGTGFEVRVDGSVVAEVPRAPIAPATSQVVFRLTRDGFTRDYTFALARTLSQEAYGKPSETNARGFLGGVGDVQGTIGLEIVPGNPAPSNVLEIAGNGVAISGDTAVAGALAGNAAFVYRRTGFAWAFEQKLGGPVGGASFGTAVAIAGDTIVVGAPHDGDGAAYVFRRTGTTWTQSQVLRPTLTTHALFGAAAAIAGTKLVIGAPNQNGTSGAAFLFTDDGATFQLAQTLTTTTDGRLGAAVAISATDLAVGAPFESSSRGAVYAAAGVDWANRTAIAGPANGSRFGTAIGLGAILVVGAPRASSNAGAALVYRRTGATWPTTATRTLADGSATSQFGSAIAVDRGRVLVGAPFDDDSPLFDNGAVYFFRCDAAGVCPKERRVLASTPGGFDSFGKAVAVTADSLIVGAPFEDSNATAIDGNQGNNAATDSGAIYISR